MADDRSGSRSLYLISKTGTLIQTVLATETLDPVLTSPEGVTAIGTGKIAFVNDVFGSQRLVIFDNAVIPVPVVNPVPTSITAISFPGLLALALALVWLGRRHLMRVQSNKD